MRRLTPSGLLALCDAARSQPSRIKATVPAAHILRWVYLEDRKDWNKDWPRCVPAPWIEIALAAVADFDEHRPVDRRCLVAFPRLHDLVRKIEALNPKLQDWTRAWLGPPPSKIIKTLAGAMSDVVRHARSLDGVAIRWPGHGPVQMGERGLLGTRFGSYLEFLETDSTVFVQDVGAMTFTAHTPAFRGAGESEALAQAVADAFSDYRTLTIAGLDFGITIEGGARWSRDGVINQIVDVKWSLLEAR